jgi:hypothetical protein
MRLINRNCYRKTGVIFSFCILITFLVLLINSPRSFIKLQTTTLKSDKNWEWSREKLNDFMHLLNKHKEPIDKNVFHFMHPTNTSTIDNKIHFPLLSKYLPYINDEESALMPSYVLTRRPIDKRG